MFPLKLEKEFFSNNQKQKKKQRFFLRSRRFCTDELTSVRLRNSSLSNVQFGWLRSNGWTYGIIFALEKKNKEQNNRSIQNLNEKITKKNDDHAIWAAIAVTTKKIVDKSMQRIIENKMICSCISDGHLLINMCL